MFRDITTLLGDARAFRRAVDELVQPWAGSKIDKVAGIEARGFILGGAVAHQVSAGFVPIRKKGKLPHTTVRIAYSLEYGVDEMEMHEDAVGKGERVILVDDLIATGGTAGAAVQLLRKIGADVVAACFVIDLPDLGGAKKIRDMGIPVRTLMRLRGALRRPREDRRPPLSHHLARRRRRSVEVIDQTRLPHVFETKRLATLADAADAIRTMVVRGAPLIGVTAAYGLCSRLRAGRVRRRA